MKLKQILIGASVVFTIVLGIGLPQQSYALSCMNPEGMIDVYMTDENLVVFTAVAGETKEYVKEPASADAADSNFQFDSGYTAQLVKVDKVHKGFSASEQYVYFEKNSTWEYLCAGNPPAAGQKTLYIVNQTGQFFSLPQVVNSFPADSDMAKKIITALEKDADNEYAAIEPMTKTDWINRLTTDIKDMIFIISVKLGELKLWTAQ